MKLRVKFKKHGPVRFIGHLDIMRYFQKCIRRAEIDICYSTGYSPHQIMSFAAPLSVGLESNGEYMDIEVNSISSSADFVRRLNEVGVPGIEVVSVKLLPEKAGNAMASVAACGYTIKFRNEISIPFSLDKAIDSFMSQKTIVIEKKTKKSTKEVDLKPGIFDFKVINGDIYLLVDASSGGNIKPVTVIEALFHFMKVSLPENALIITREDTYMNELDNEDDVKHFIPLDGIGEEIHARI